MSDVQQAPDWWLASDGKWYPPQSRPAPPPPPARPPAPPPPPPLSPFATAPTPWATPYHPLPQSTIARPPSVSSTLSGWLQALMWATGGMALITGVLGFLALGAFEDYTSTRFGTSAERRAFDDWSDLNDAFDTFNALLTLVWIALFVVTIVWMNKAHKATQRLWLGSRKWSSGWTVGGWFIPFANFFIPKGVLNEIERIAMAPRMGGLVDHRWHQESTSVKGWLWWIGLSAGILLRTIGAGVFDVTGTDDEINAGYGLQAFGSLVAAAALPLGALYIRRLGHRLSPRGVIENP